MFVKGENCEFHVDSYSFLGYTVEKGQLKPDPAKSQAVIDWLLPANCKHLQPFLGFSNFYLKFIKDFSEIALPLTQLTQVSFQCNSSTQSDFNLLKHRFCSATVRTTPASSLWR